jgi:hypothetical protein
MLASILIIGFSLILFVYWFRYSCILLLRSFSEQPESANSHSDSRFSFAHVREQLKDGLELDPLHQALDRDYRMISYLLQHAPDLELQSLEDRLLVLDYRVMRCYYRFTRTIAPLHARSALVEMATVLGILAQKIGEQAGLRNEA